MTKLYIQLLAITFLFVACEQQGADVKTGSSASASAPYVWSQSKFPLRVKITDAFNGDEVTAITNGAEQWESSTGNARNFFEIQSDRPIETTNATFNSNALNDSEMVVYRTTQWPWDRYVLAITQLWGYRYNAGTASEYVDILHADILVNYRDNSFITSGTSGYDLQTVLLHEFGHFLGLQHIESSPSTNKSKSIMYPSISFGEKRQTPFQYDINKIKDLYGIVSGSSGSSASVAAKQAAEERFTAFDDGKEVIIQLELRVDGECVHKENGVIVHRHRSPHFN